MGGGLKSDRACERADDADGSRTLDDRQVAIPRVYLAQHRVDRAHSVAHVRGERTGRRVHDRRVSRVGVVHRVGRRHHVQVKHRGAIDEVIVR